MIHFSRSTIGLPALYYFLTLKYFQENVDLRLVPYAAIHTKQDSDQFFLVPKVWWSTFLQWIHYEPSGEAMSEVLHWRNRLCRDGYGMILALSRNTQQITQNRRERYIKRGRKMLHRSTTKYYKFGQVCKRESVVTALKIQWRMRNFMAC